MTPIDPIYASMTLPNVAAPPQPSSSPMKSFARVLEGGLRAAESKIAHADALAARFAVDDSVPLHQVTIALEEARLSVEVMMQIRGRMLDA